ncbi:hypothetical protein SESBI_37179 [Sesbania bispinosa]|nr:hypothetical protein SESBI_37179 [Sesbania bispinosa]
MSVSKHSSHQVSISLEPFCLMKKSPLHVHQALDLEEDFSQFLEEAKQHVNEAKLKISSVHPEESEKKDKKSWKSSLVSWWKADKKSKHQVIQSKVSVSGKRKNNVSGPIYNCGKGPDVNVKYRRPISGPLTNLFKPTKSEIPIPYMSLHQQNSPRPVYNYGPLYVVT